MPPSFLMTVIMPLSTENLRTSFIGIQNVVPSFIWIISRMLASGSAGAVPDFLGSTAAGVSVFFGAGFVVLTGAFEGFVTGGVTFFSSGFDSGAGSTVTLAVSFS